VQDCTIIGWFSGDSAIVFWLPHSVHGERMKLKSLVKFAVWCLSSSLSCAAGIDWVVISPAAKGDAAQSESGESGAAQFATLELAVKKLSEIRKAPGKDQFPDGLTIRLRSGIHRLSSSVVLGPEISDFKSPLTIAGPADKSAIVSGGKALKSPSKVHDNGALVRLPRESRGNVVQYDLRAEGISEFGLAEWRKYWPSQESAAGQMELFFRGKPMVLARWPNEQYAKLSVRESGTDAGRSFLLEGAHADKLVNEPALMATAYWGEDWASETIPVVSVDAKSGLFLLKPPGPQHGIKAQQRIFLQNALSELDSPGEWYLDRSSGILYFWPPATIREGDVEVSMVSSLFVVKGARSLKLSGITLDTARGDALAIEAGTNIQVENVTVRNVGGRAANVQGSDNHFTNIDVYDTGEGGVYLWGGNRQTLTSANHSVENSRFRRFNRLSRTYRPAVHLHGVGSRAIGNVISDGTHNAIMFFGNNHQIAYNEIYRVAIETGDVGAIYTGRDWTARGTVIRNNYFHDIHGPGLHGSRGVYLDDQASGITVKGNLFARVDRAIYVGGGRDNVIEDNLMVSSSPAIHLDARGLTWQRALTDDKQGVLRKWLQYVPIDSKPYRDQYPNLTKILDDEPGAPKYNVIQRNIVIDGQALDVADGANRWLKGDALIKAGDIQFRGGVKIPRGEKPSDYAFESLSKSLFGLPTQAMDCVSDRWRRADRGLPPGACKLE